MKRNKMLSLGLTLLLGLSGVGLSNGQVVRADTTGVSPVGITYRGQVQNIGWQPYVSDGAEAGTDGKGFRVEALNIKLVNAPAGASILYQGHVQNIGWQSVVSDGAEMGTDGEGLRVEAFKLALAGMPGYSIEYRAHVQNIGWQPWVSDGAEAGTDGKGLRVEAIEIKIVKTADGNTPVPVPFVDVNGNPIGNTTTGSGATGTIPATGSSVTVISASQIQVKFSNAPEDTSKVVFNVTRQGNAVPLNTSWNSTNTVATLTYNSNLPADTYVVDVKDGTTDLGSSNVSVSAQQVSKIIISSTILSVDKNSGNGYASYQVLDQYGNDITTSDSSNGIAWTCGIGQINARNGLLTVVPSSGSTLSQYTSATINGYDAGNGASVSATINVL